ncbi:MAG TPA: hypothetical protein VFM54_23740 [Micromonosporaceae bacterium]|nr:hypothetical protein [Micromonosporaceae bacterium]
MDEQPTCGKGLAAHSALPAKLSELMAGVAENLEVHMPALDVQDPSARREHDAYRALVQEHRTIAAQLSETARHMAGYRDLPMGRHDETAMADPAVARAFERFVGAKRELANLLQQSAEEDRGLLAQMGGAAGTPPSAPPSPAAPSPTG